MIPTSSGLIYSPKHYSLYTRDGDGVGVWVGGDVAKWNIVWLSVPSVDQYLTPLAHLEIAAGLDCRLIGSVMALARQEMSPVMPGLRSALLEDPNGLLNLIDRLPMKDTYAWGIGGQAWLDTLRQRIRFLTGESDVPSKDVAKAERVVIGNVIHHDFTARSR